MPTAREKEQLEAIREALGRRVSSEQASATTESLGEIFKGKFTDKNKLFAILDVLASGQQAAVGLVQEQRRRSKGFQPIPRSVAMKSAIRRSASFNEVTGNAFTGFLLDVTVDPTNILAFGAVRGLVVKGVGAAGKAAKVPALASKIDEGVESVDMLRRTKVFLGQAFNKEFMLRRVGAGKLLDARARYGQKLAEANYLAGRDILRRVEKLVPDPKQREEIFDLLEHRPNFVSNSSVEPLVDFRRRFSLLNADEKIAYRTSVRVLDQLEEAKIGAGLLPAQQAAGLLAKMGGLSYVPHHMATRSSLQDYLAKLTKSWDELPKGADGTELVSGMKFDEIQKWAKQIDEMPESVNVPIREALAKHSLNHKPTFTLTREIAESGKEIKRQGFEGINLDIAQVLQVESARVASAIAKQNYMKDIANYITSTGLAFTETELRSSPRMVQKALADKFGEKTAKRLWRDSFRKLKRSDIPGMEGLQLPNALADEIELVSKAYRSSFKVGGPVEGTYKAWLQLTGLWKAWTLAPIPGYHFRNFISNLWNQSLSGMSPTAMVQHNFHASALRMQWAKGIFTDEKIAGIGLSSRELNVVAAKHSILNSGHIVGELTNTVIDNGRVGGFITRQIDPRTSWVIKKGFQTGNYIEDSNRLALFMHQLSKGDKVEDAAKVVQKYLFDYKHGLTQFEEKIFRDTTIPFYAWTRFNLPLQLERLVATPYKFTSVFKGKRAYESFQGGPEPDEAVLAEWIKNTPNIRFGFDKETETYNYFLLGNFWPAADVGRFLGSNRGKELINMIHPFPKLAYELIQNHNIFQDRPIKDFPGQKKKVLGASMEPVAEHLLRTIRVINDIDRTATFALQGDDLSSMFFRAVGRTFLGRVYPVDFKSQKRFWQTSMRKDIIALKGKRKGAERRGDVENVRALDELIEKYEKLVKEHGEAKPASFNKRTRKRTRQKPPK